MRAQGNVLEVKNAGKQDTVSSYGGSGCVLTDNRNGGRVKPCVNITWTKTVSSRGGVQLNAFLKCIL